MKRILSFLSFLIVAFSQESAIVEIETYDGNIFLGTITSETEEKIILKTKDGIEISIAKELVKKSQQIETVSVGKEVWRADPNKSLYLFSPSAFPIEEHKAYCRDFCLFFPSYNRGYGNNFSLQAGAFIFPGVSVDDMPIILSGKFSLPQLGPARLAAGIMYVSLPAQDNSYGAGIAFGTATFGNKFSHGSVSLGWGYIKDNNNWEFADEPTVTLASNIRLSNSLAIVTEYWKFPGVDDPMDLPLIISGRFIGRKIAVDIGTFLFRNMDGIPPPLINFTYHF